MLGRGLSANCRRRTIDSACWKGSAVPPWRQVRSLIAQARDAGKCVIVSTHILGEAERLCDRLVFLDHGQVVAEGTPQGLCEQAGVDTVEDAFLNMVGREDVELVA